MFHYRRKLIVILIHQKNPEKMMPKTLCRLSKYFVCIICDMVCVIIAQKMYFLIIGTKEPTKIVQTTV